MSSSGTFKLTFPNVLITGHQAFFTADAMQAIAATTIDNLSRFATEGLPRHPVTMAAPPRSDSGASIS